MTAWPQQSNGLYPGMLDGSGSTNSNLVDPSMMSMYNGNGHGYNPNQFSNQMSNGSINPAAFQNQTFNVGSVVPSKRPREDGMAVSPRPGQPNGMNTSRSQTPMQQNPQYPSGQPGQPGQPTQQYQAPNPYQHLQHTGSANATPSPTMQNQPFRAPPPPQRVATGSPATFNQMLPAMGSQMSPGGQSQNSNAMSPQAGQGQNYIPNVNVNGGQAYGQQGMMAGNMQGGIPGQGVNVANNPQMAAQLQQRRYQQQLVQTQQRMQASNAANQRPMTTQPGQGMQQQMAQAGQGVPNGQQQQQQSQQQQAAMQKQQQWLRTLANHLQQQGKPLNPNPNIAGRPVSVYMIWACIIQAGGGGRVTQGNLWPAIAQKLGFTNNPQAVQDIRQAHEMYLSSYEQIYINARMHARQQQAQQQARQMAGLPGPQQSSPTRPMQSSPLDTLPNQYMQPIQPQGQQPGLQTPVQQVSQVQRNPSFPPNGNGMTAPSPVMGTPLQQQGDLGQIRRSSSLKQSDPLALDQTTSPAVAIKAGSMGPTVKREASSGSVKQIVQEETTEYQTHSYNLDRYGGVDMSFFEKKEMASLIELAPDVPCVEDMGWIDIRALGMSLQSGIHAEVRHAIDSLVLLSHHRSVVLDLNQCEDLVDIIVDCAEEQIEILVDGAVEVSDAVDLVPYEDAIRLARAEAEALQDLPPFGSTAHNLERAADRLIGLTTLLRNFSQTEYNNRLLSEKSVITMLSTAIKYLGTRNMFLRSFANVVDFYKDVVCFFSSITDKLELPSREDALNILHFLLAFAPQPAPIVKPGTPIRVVPFMPQVHRYLPLAVDCLAKLLARQDPNRGFYRSIFTSGPSQSSTDDLTPSDLLTRAFALCVCVLPNRSRGTLSSSTEIRTVEARKAALIQGMLAADILASILPSNSNDPLQSNLARSWLESEDRWAAGLLRMAYVLSTDRGQSSQRGHQQARAGPDGRLQLAPDEQGYGMIAHRGLSMLKRLVEKGGVGKRGSEDEPEEVDDSTEEDVLKVPEWSLKGDPIPHKETLVGALLLPNADKDALRLLSGLYETVVS